MAKLTPEQQRMRERAEALIRLMVPALNMVLAVGERMSRIVEPDDPEYVPAHVQRSGAGAGANGGGPSGGD